jgi:hypothetical protein
MTTRGIPDRVVAVANGDYARLIPLPRAVPDTNDLAALLKERHGFDTVLLADRRRGALLDEIDNTLAADLSQKRIQRWPILGGLLNEYQRAA